MICSPLKHKRRSITYSKLRSKSIRTSLSIWVSFRLETSQLRKQRLTGPLRCLTLTFWTAQTTQDLVSTVSHLIKVVSCYRQATRLMPLTRLSRPLEVWLDLSIRWLRCLSAIIRSFRLRMHSTRSCTHRTRKELPSAWRALATKIWMSLALTGRNKTRLQLNALSSSKRPYWIDNPFTFPTGRKSAHTG